MHTPPPPAPRATRASRRFGLWLALVGLLLLNTGFAVEHNHWVPYMSGQLRYTPLPLFNPHRTDFTCVHQDAVLPPLDPQAEAWFQEGMALTSPELWDSDRDYAKAAQLWAKAAERKHWKALNNLTVLYQDGQGVPRNPEKALELTEQGMAWGFPQAWDTMGSFHMSGMGSLSPDATAAYAFWQKAAEMGSPSAQTDLGEKLMASYDNPKESFWANETIGRKMVECAFAQGYGPAAYQLGITTERIDAPRALTYYHEGVKFGSEDCAGYLWSSFDNGKDAAPFVDKDRARRYEVFMDALNLNPYLRFPNLDKVLPLPPAKLPYWDGDKKSLLDAAKAVRPAPQPAKLPAHGLSGRYHLPSGYRLAGTPPGAALLPGTAHLAMKGDVPHD